MAAYSEAQQNNWLISSGFKNGFSLRPNFVNSPLNQDAAVNEAVYKASKLKTSKSLNPPTFSNLIFFGKVAFASALIEKIACSLFHSQAFYENLLFYCITVSVTFYGWGSFIEFILKPPIQSTSSLSMRKFAVKKQPYPAFDLVGVFIGEIKSAVFSAAILYMSAHALPTVKTQSIKSSLISEFFFQLIWFFLAYLSADLLFYWSHRFLHLPKFYVIHKVHHEFKDTSSFVAGHKSFLEYCITTITDILPFILFGGTTQQLVAWSVVGVLFNLEGHSGLGFLFISSNFHDLHHTHVTGNYGVQPLWDIVFGTLHPKTFGGGVQTLEGVHTDETNVVPIFNAILLSSIAEGLILFLMVSLRPLLK